jgi:biotin transport system substrate-specific component
MTSSLIIKNYDFPFQRSELSSRIFGISLFSVLTILGAKLEIPAYPVPFTLQTLFVLLSGAFLGRKDGAICQLIYIFIGASGLPVFAGPIAGLSRILGPTGGYLLAFPIAAYFTGFSLEFKTGLLGSCISLLSGTFIIYSIGVFYLNIFYLHNFSESIMLGLVIFSAWEIVKVVTAGFILMKFEQHKNKI